MLEGHAHSHNAGADAAIIGYLIANHSAGSRIDDQPDISFDAPDFDISLISNKGRILFVRISIDKWFDTDSSGFAVVSDHLVRDGNAMYILHRLGGFPKRQTQVDPIGEAEGHDVSVIPGEFQRRGILRQGGDVHLKEVDREFTVDVMELIFVLTIVFIQIRLINLFQVAKVVWAFEIHTFMDDEVLTIFLTRQRMGTVRTLEGNGPGEAILIGRKESSAHLAHQLAGLAIVTVQEILRRFAGRTGTVLRNIAFGAASYRSDRLAVFPGIVAVEIFPVPVLLVINNLRELIHLELLVLGRMGIIKGPLFKRDISADEVDKPAVLLIKLMT